MTSDDNDFKKAIRTGDIVFLHEYLRKNPGDLNQKLSWDHYDGYPLNYAAFCNQPKVISFLVLEHRADVNRNQDVGANWTPLRHAQEKSSYEAAAMLLSLGADPNVSSSDGKTTTQDFCKSREVQKHYDPYYAEKKKAMEREAQEKRIAGTWSRTGEREIMHDYERPDIGCRLIDIFNFETRCLRALVKSTDGQGMAQSILFFDDMPDKEILRPAVQKLKELGCDIDENDVAGGRMLKKHSQLRPS